MRKWMKYISNQICAGNGEFLARLVILGIALVCTAGAIAGENQKPQVSISLVGTADSVVEQGEPVRVTVKLGVNNGETTSFVIWPESGDWTDAVSVNLFDVDGGQTGSGRVLGSPDKPEAVLAPDRIAGGLWRFSAGFMEAVPAGNYIIRARLAVSVAAPGSEGWTGEVFSNDVPLEVVTLSSEPERLTQRTLALASDMILDVQLEEAASVLDLFLLSQPDDMEVWMLRGLVCENAGNLAGALYCVNRAQIIYKSFGLSEPDLDLHEMQVRIIAAMLEPSAEMAPEPPSWSWPPAELLLREKNPVLPATEDRPPDPTNNPDEEPSLDTKNPPSNDECQNAELIEEGVYQTFDTSYATFDGPGHCIISPNIWYIYTATCTGHATVSLCGSSYDTKLAVYDGAACDPSLRRLIECNDDSCGLQSEITFDVTVGKQYLIEVGGFGYDIGQGLISISCEGTAQTGQSDLVDAPRQQQ